MKRKKSIVYLKRNQLEPHPQNPRVFSMSFLVS